jgi:hypothetical protein
MTLELVVCLVSFSIGLFTGLFIHKDVMIVINSSLNKKVGDQKFSTYKTQPSSERRKYKNPHTGSSIDTLNRPTRKKR